MKHSIILAVVMLLQSTALVHAADAGPQAPIDAMVMAFNKGDVAGIHAAHVTGDVSLMDEVPPHLWHGPKAIDAWLTDLAAHDKARGRTDGVVTLSKPQVMTTQGNDGYAVVPDPRQRCSHARRATGPGSRMCRPPRSSAAQPRRARRAHRRGPRPAPHAAGYA